MIASAIDRWSAAAGVDGGTAKVLGRLDCGDQDIFWRPGPSQGPSITSTAQGWPKHAAFFQKWEWSSFP
jgi:hypothetical protein